MTTHDTRLHSPTPTDRERNDHCVTHTHTHTHTAGEHHKVKQKTGRSGEATTGPERKTQRCRNVHHHEALFAKADLLRCRNDREKIALGV